MAAAGSVNGGPCAGRITAAAARTHAEHQYEAYRRTLDSQPSPVEVHFDEAVQKAKQLAAPKKKAEKKSEKEE